MCFASGFGATTAIAHLINSGDHFVSVDDLFGGTFRNFNKISIYSPSLIAHISAGIILWNGRSKFHFLFYFPFHLDCLTLHCVNF